MNDQDSTTEFEQTSMLDCTDLTYEQVERINQWHHKATQARVREVLERLKGQQRDYHTISNPGNIMPAVRVKHIDAELAKLGEQE